MGYSLIRVRVILHSVLRELLPEETGGKTDLDLLEGSSILDVAHKLNLPDHYNVSVNNKLERDHHRELRDGDELRFFRPSAGG